MASNQTIENIANILGMLKEFNEPYKEAEKRMQEMAFEKDMVELKFEQQIELSEKAIEAQKKFEQWKITDPTMKAETERLEEIAKDEADAVRQGAENVARIRVKGEKEIVELSNTAKENIQKDIDNDVVDRDARQALISLLEKDAEGLLTIEDLDSAKGNILGFLPGRELFYDTDKKAAIAVVTDFFSGLGLYGAGKVTAKGGQAIMTSVPHPVAKLAGGGLMALGYGMQFVGAPIKGAQAVGGLGAAGAEELEPLTGMNFNYKREKKLDSILKNRSLMTNELTQSAIEGQKGMETGTQSGKTLQSLLNDKKKKLEDPDLELFIERYGTDAQKETYENQNKALLNLVNIIY